MTKKTITVEVACVGGDEFALFVHIDDGETTHTWSSVATFDEKNANWHRIAIASAAETGDAIATFIAAQAIGAWSDEGTCPSDLINHS